MMNLSWHFSVLILTTELSTSESSRRTQTSAAKVIPIQIVSPDPESGSGIPDMDDFQTLLRTALCKDTVMIKLSRKSEPVF